MQVFIVGSPLETAKAMARDTRRYNKQIIEVRQILDALNGTKAWRNHPCTLQYKDYEEWLCDYHNCLLHYREYLKFGNTEENYLGYAEFYSASAEDNKPTFHTEEYFKQMKRRLYTKDPIYYAQWVNLGTSEENWYFVEGEWRVYRNGKRIK